MQNEAGLSRALPACEEDQDSPLLDFQVEVHTAPTPGAGTDVRVYVALEGDKGQMQRVRAFFHPAAEHCSGLATVYSRLSKGCASLPVKSTACLRPHRTCQTRKRWDRSLSQQV